MDTPWSSWRPPRTWWWAEVRWLRGPVSAATQVVTFRSSHWPADGFAAALASEDADGDGVWDRAHHVSGGTGSRRRSASGPTPRSTSAPDGS